MILKEYKNFNEIPRNYRRSIAQMHFKWGGLMIDAFHDKKNVSEIVILIDDTIDAPVGWYIIWNEDAMFWVKTRYRGKGYGKMLTEHFFNFAKSNKKRAFTVYDSIGEIAKKFYPSVSNIWIC